MTTMVVEFYETLTKAGVDEKLAKEAAKAFLDTGMLAMKKDLAECAQKLLSGIQARYWLQRECSR